MSRNLQEVEMLIMCVGRIRRHQYEEKKTVIDSFLTLTTNLGPCTLLYYALAVTQLIGIEGKTVVHSHF